MSGINKSNYELFINEADYNLFSVKLSAYIAQVIKILKNIRGREYNPENKTWYLLLNMYDILKA